MLLFTLFGATAGWIVVLRSSSIGPNDEATRPQPTEQPFYASFAVHKHLSRLYQGYFAQSPPSPPPAPPPAPPPHPAPPPSPPPPLAPPPPLPPPPSIEFQLAELNRRFGDGRANADLEAAGLCVKAHTRRESIRDGHPWLFRGVTDRVSTSLINVRLPFFYQGDEFGTAGPTALWVVDSAIASRALQCSYEMDAATVDRGLLGCAASYEEPDRGWCDSTAPTRWNGQLEDSTYDNRGGFPERVERADGGWEGTCAWRNTTLDKMLRAHEARVSRCGAKHPKAKPGPYCCVCCNYPRCSLYKYMPRLALPCAFPCAFLRLPRPHPAHTCHIPA